MFSSLTADTCTSVIPSYTTPPGPPMASRSGTRLPLSPPSKYHGYVRNKLTRELAVCGIAAVRALLDRRPDSVRRFFFEASLLAEFRPILRSFAERKTLYRMVSPEELERLAGTVHHQGAVAMIEAPEVPALDAPTASGWAARGERFLVLDNLGNDHNLGAVLRSAAFFGVRNLVVAGASATNLVTTSAFRVAEGGMEWVSLYRIADAGELARLAGPGLAILGADHRGSSTAREALTGLAPGRAVALVLGNEETGLSRASRAACSALVRIPGSGNLESLNVAQSAAIFLYELAFGAAAPKTGVPPRAPGTVPERPTGPASRPGRSPARPSRSSPGRRQDPPE